MLATLSWAAVHAGMTCRDVWQPYGLTCAMPMCTQ